MKVCRAPHQLFLYVTFACVAFQSLEALPPKEENLQELSFETDEATWLALDASPDDTTLVLEVLGDIYTLPTTGGRATQLTHDIAFESQPSYSPDGKWIAYISDTTGIDNLWIMATDGSNARRLSDLGERMELASPSWAPDSSHVIVSRTSWGLNTFEIWAYALDGGKGVKLTDATSGSTNRQSNYNALGAVYSPDTKYLYYAFKRGGFGYNVTLPLWQIVRRHIQTERDDTLTNEQGSAFRPQLSSDGQWLTYGTRFQHETGLRIRNLQTGEDRWLAYPIQHDEQESKYTRDLLPDYSFSSDGNSVYFTSNGKIHNIDIETGTIENIPFVIPVRLKYLPKETFPHRLGIGPVKATLVRAPSINPDGTKVAFSALARIYTYELDSGKLVAISPQGMFAAYPTWSPDGKYISYVNWTATGGHVWRSNANGKGNPKRLTRKPAYFSEPVYLPDGDQLVVLRGNARNRQQTGWESGTLSATDVVIIDAKRESDPVFVQHAPLLQKPHLGPESDRIYFYQYPGLFRSGSGGIVSMRLDGLDYQRHFELKGPGIYFTDEKVPAERMQISPNGKYIFAQHANQLYLLRSLGDVPHRISTEITNTSLPIAQLTKVGADDIGWTKDSRAIYWSVGHSFFLREIDSIVFTNRIDDDEKDEASEDTSEADNAEDHSEEHADQVEASDFEAHADLKKWDIAVYRPRSEPERSLVLRNVNLIPIDSDVAEVFIDTDVFIEGGRIADIGRDLDVPHSVEQFDVTGKYLVPGYVDTHAHFSIKRRVLGSDVWALHANLAYGVTTAIDVQPSTVDILEYADLVEAGDLIGPRLLSTGPGVFNNNIFKSRDDTKKVLTRYKQHYGVNNIKAYISGTRKQRLWLNDAAKELKLNVTTEGALDMKRNITHALDGFAGNEHNLPVLGIYEDVVQLYGRTQIGYTPTLLVAYGGPFGLAHYVASENPLGDTKLTRFTPPNVLAYTLHRSSYAHPNEHVYSIHAEHLVRIIEANGRIGVGSHGELQGLGFHWELWAMASNGMKPFDALRAATRHGAEMIGVDQDVGSVEPGKLADFVVLNQNPLDALHATADVAYVVKNGVIYDAETLDEISPNRRPLPDPAWIAEQPIPQPMITP